jgi:uncharacterized damage-inducible protein DinB
MRCFGGCWPSTTAPTERDRLPGLIRLPALGFVQFAINHTIHTGQLSVYLGAMGATVQPIDG